ncbi:MAG: biotin--[Clostridia bacterium]|nr:biotin--[acetyl-CoA-carboxylase] ligase [Clostridia bacterium]
MDKNDYEKIKNAVLGSFFYYDEIESTNTEALNSENAPDKSLFLAKNQTHGKGRKGRCWEASRGGIYMTVLVKPKEITEDISALTLAVGLAVSRVIPKSQIKWPNDVILGDKKVAGILLETKITGKTGVIAIGVGINANNTSFSEELSEKATSIRLFSGEKQNETELVLKVYNEILKVLDEFSQGFGKIREEYIKKCIILNREITVVENSKNRKMYAVGIGEKGELLAECDGEIERITFGEVSVRGLLGYCL